jgi:hypothetical protein
VYARLRPVSKKEYQIHEDNAENRKLEIIKVKDKMVFLQDVEMNTEKILKEKSYGFNDAYS